MNRNAALTTAFFLLAACSYSPPEDKVLQIFERHSFREHDPEEIRALLRAKGPAGLKELDPHAAVVLKKTEVRVVPLDPPVSSGMLAGLVGEGYYLLRVMRDSPAAKAGLRDGDRLLSVNGHPPGSEGFREALSGQGSLRIKAARSTRGGVSQFEASVTPAPFGTPQIFGFFEPQTKTAFLRLSLFFEGSAAAAGSALDALAGYGARNVVLDVRGNGGGSPSEVSDVLRLFARRPGPTLGVHSRHRGYFKVYAAAGPGRHSRLRAVVLTDARTSMTAEVFAAAMQDIAGARVIGSATAGNVSLQRTFALSKGRGLMLTVAHIYPPSGRELGGDGLAPDVPVSNPGPAPWGSLSAWSLFSDTAYQRALTYLAN